jgi:hypothetical protein
MSSAIMPVPAVMVSVKSQPVPVAMSQSKRKVVSPVAVPLVMAVKSTSFKGAVPVVEEEERVTEKLIAFALDERTKIPKNEKIVIKELDAKEREKNKSVNKEQWNKERNCLNKLVIIDFISTYLSKIHILDFPIKT